MSLLFPFFYLECRCDGQRLSRSSVTKYICLLLYSSLWNSSSNGAEKYCQINEIISQSINQLINKAEIYLFVSYLVFISYRDFCCQYEDGVFKARLRNGCLYLLAMCPLASHLLFINFHLITCKQTISIMNDCCKDLRLLTMQLICCPAYYSF